MRLLSDYPWPSNVRQLANVVEQMVVLTQNDLIARDDVPVDLIDGRDRDKTSPWILQILRRHTPYLSGVFCAML